MCMCACMSMDVFVFSSFTFTLTNTDVVCLFHTFRFWCRFIWPKLSVENQIVFNHTHNCLLLLSIEFLWNAHWLYFSTAIFVFPWQNCRWQYDRVGNIHCYFERYFDLRKLLRSMHSMDLVSLYCHSFLCICVNFCSCRICVHFVCMCAWNCGNFPISHCAPDIRNWWNCKMAVYSSYLTLRSTS